MVFSSLDFIFKFLPVFLFLYAICPCKWKNLCLFVGSLLFYSYGVKDQPVYLLLFLFSMGINFAIGKQIGRRRSRKRNNKKKMWLAAGLSYNFFWLFLFKYSGFLAENWNQLASGFGLQARLPVFQPILPIGISFYTFQAVSYLIDVYRGSAARERSFIDFGMYISMFPQLIAGPIVTYASVEKQIKSRSSSWPMIEDGLREFTIGLGLKVLLANQVGGLWEKVEMIGFESISTPLAWMGLIAFSLQIYFDFYGYSLMAKGLGSVLGFRFPCNFAHPYMSTSMTEFWRRWHITLGSWFRDYVYIPLGGNRNGSWKTVRNLFVVWILTGFWHGASWNFMLWGLVLFILIFLEKAGVGKLLETRPVVGHIYMLFAIPLTWLLFAVTDLSQMAVYFQRLFPFLPQSEDFVYFAGDYLKYGRLYAVSLGAGLIFMTPFPRKLYDRWKDSPISAVALLAVFWGCVYCMKIGMDDPFLYFRF
ncbi:MAG: MBOAT family O-acyltransferase [Lachnospiraceae bacterium]